MLRESKMTKKIPSFFFLPQKLDVFYSSWWHEGHTKSISKLGVVVSVVHSDGHTDVSHVISSFCSVLSLKLSKAECVSLSSWLPLKTPDRSHEWRMQESHHHRCWTWVLPNVSVLGILLILPACNILSSSRWEKDLYLLSNHVNEHRPASFPQPFVSGMKPDDDTCLMLCLHESLTVVDVHWLGK